MRRRPAITLVEVLVAIFIMAIGLLALLTLFPLGALRMAAALQDERAALAASAGANICDAFDLRHDPQYDNPQASLSPGPLFLTPPGFPGNGLAPASPNGGGIPVYVDPWGLSGGLGNSLGASGNLTPGIWRVGPSPSKMPPPYNTIPVQARYFSLLDDLTYANDGLPAASNGAPPVTSSDTIQRAGRYTWAYLLKRPQPGNMRSPIDLTVVVYAGRPPTLQATSESTFQALGVWNDTLVTLTCPAGPPSSLRRGSWILDTSYNKFTGSVNGDFYRVVAVTQTSPTQINLELQSPMTRPPAAQPNSTPQAGQVSVTAVTVMDNVVEVFFRGVAPSSQWEFHAQP